MKTSKIPLISLMAVLTCGIYVQVEAQYYSQNKVQYKDFDFQKLATNHFDIYYYPVEEEGARVAARMAEKWYGRYVTLFNHELSSRQPLILYASHSDFEQTNIIQGQIGEGTGGVTEGLLRRIVLPFGGPLAETDHVIGHELVHAFQYDMGSDSTGGLLSRGPAAAYLPLWLIEGMAEYYSIGPLDPHTAMWMRDAAQSKRLPKYKQLERPEYFPYRYGQALLAYIGGTYGDEAVTQLLKSALGSRDVDMAIRRVTGISPDTLVLDWQAEIHDLYDPVKARTKSVDQYGKQLTGQSRKGTELNIAPALSPDGTQMLYFSERNLFFINMFLANAQTGKVESAIVSRERNPHLESLEFINSAGAWDATGQRIAYGAIEQGRPILYVRNVQTRRIEHRVPLPSLGEILNPTWAPDGSAIAFSAMIGGYTDLFIYHLDTDQLERVTNDLYAEIQPAWAPDGRSIAFVTDRFSTDLSSLSTGNYQLALCDVQSGEITRLPAFRHGKHVNPQWSSDGRSLYFLSDVDGITNIYRRDTTTGKLFKITDLYTGVSGITAISPALSVASNANSLVFNVYQDGKYHLFRVDNLSELVGEEVSAEVDVNRLAGRDSPAWLPPGYRDDSEVLAELRTPPKNLAQSDQYESEKYRPRLRLLSVGEPYLMGGVSQFGTELAGGASLYWSDLLTEHELLTAVQVQSNGVFTDLGVVLGYQNNAQRWNWGGILQQQPYTLYQYAIGYGQVNGETAYIEQDYYYRQIDRELLGVTVYPFNKIMRSEFSVGVRNIQFQQEIVTRAFSMSSGDRILNEKQKLPAPDQLYLAEGSAALFYDFSFFGATSPIFGQTYSLQFAPALGTINFYSVLADYRRYFLPIRPFTLAFRALHYGRYGQDSEDSRLMPLFLGYQSLVRGYDSYSFSTGECTASASDQCPEFTRLTGSRLIVANAELRFPFFGVFGLGRGYYGIFPLETALFYDLGLAWNSTAEPTFLGGPRKPVSSYGAAVRVNLFGYAVLEADYVYPVNRPKKGWFWQINFTPGF